MAEAAAPAPAPSTGAPADAGAAQPTPGGDAAALAPIASPSPDKSERLARTLKPIPPLPGVFPDDDPFPAPSDATSPSGERTRGPDGRYLAASPSTPPVAGEDALGQRDAPPPEPAKTEKIKFAGEEWDSNDAIEQNFKSLRGNFKPLMGLAKHLGGIDKIAPHMAQAADSARAWKAEHDRVKAELDAMRGGKPATNGAAKQQVAPTAPAETDSVDWELYAEVKKLATDSGEPWKAEQWLIEQVRKGERARVDKLIEDRFAPITAAQSKMQFVERTEALVEHVAAFTNEDGSQAFPELHDEAAAKEIGRLWVSLGLPPEAALTPQGMIAAIATYRMRSQPQARSANAPAPAPALPPPSTPADTRIAAGLVDGRPMGAMSVGDAGTPSAEAARILAGLREVNQGSRSHLGFDP